MQIVYFPTKRVYENFTRGDRFLVSRPESRRQKRTLWRRHSSCPSGGSSEGHRLKGAQGNLYLSRTKLCILLRSRRIVISF